MEEFLKKIANQFAFDGKVKEVRKFGEGLINETFFVETEGNKPDYILQRKNKNVFTDVLTMMDNIRKVTEHIKAKVTAAGGDPLREALTVIPTTEGKFCYEDEDGEFWAACLFIDDTVTYQFADCVELAEQGGRGIGKFQALLSDMNEPLADILPGFHNISYRLKQWDEVLAKDPVQRKSQVLEEIEHIEKRREEMLAFWAKVESGEIPMRVTHNDTKISNILFDKQGSVLCVIDLDTVLNSTCLNDFGDAIRSYANAGLEDDENLENVYLNMDIFEAYTKGYLDEARSFLIPSETEYLAFSAKYITYEQVLRFLMDYIDGDRYYRVKDEKHNLVRARAQLKLLHSIESNYDLMRGVVDKYSSL